MTNIPQEEHPTDEDPRERLRSWVHAVDMRVAMGKVEMPGAAVSLGVMLTTPETGRVTAQFEAEPFLKDIRDLVDTDNLWVPGPAPLFLYLVEFEPTYGHADRGLVAAHDEEHAREIALNGDDDVTIKSVRLIGKANVPHDLDDEEAPGPPVEPGNLMAEFDPVT